MYPTPEIILGPPGTGKTTTLLRIVQDELTGGTPPERIGYFSFTRKAADEARDRAVEKFGLDKKRFRNFRTLHSLAFQSLGINKGEVFEGEKVHKFGDFIGMRMTGKFRTEEGTTAGFEKGDRILFMENLARIRNIPLRQQYDENDDEQRWDEVKYVADSLAVYKDQWNLLDFTDMLVRFLKQDAFMPEMDVLIIDEAQDLSPIQWEVAKKLSLNARRYVIAGDDDQAIYRWAGADVDQFIGMTGDVRVLGQSYRVPLAVQKISDMAISRVKTRRKKVWKPREEIGVVDKRHIEDIDFSKGEILVLARNVVYLRQVEQRLKQIGYLYMFRDWPSVSDSLRSAIVEWTRVHKEPGNTISVADAKLVHEFMSPGKGYKRGNKLLPNFGAGDRISLDQWVEHGGLQVRGKIWHEALDKLTLTEITYIRSCLRQKEKLSQAPRIRLSTIHGAKGGEAPHVVIIPDIAPRTWKEYMDNPEDEARVWYVAATRAKERLTLTIPKSNRCWNY